MKIVELECKNCGAPLATDNVNDRLDVARCPHCRTIFALETLARPTPSRPGGTLPARLLFKPKHFEVLHKCDELVIQGLPAARLFWVGPILLLCIFYPLFMIRDYSLQEEEGLIALMPLGFTVIAALAAAAILSTALRKIVIRVGPEKLSCIREGLWKKHFCDVPVESIVQLYVREYPTGGNDGRSIRYQLYLVRDLGGREVIYDDFYTPEQALYIEQEIEKRLGLENIRVGDVGEISR
jgi:hypothetical protein